MKYSSHRSANMKRFIYSYLFIFLVSVKVRADVKFPENFRFGVATSAYQIEGAWNTSGKGENIWDYLTHNSPDLIIGEANGDIACDSYHKIKEDVQLIKKLGVSFYRFSLSWSRILPTGFVNQINPDGIRYYNELIDELLANGIEPFVTLFHWDLPQPLQELGGWPNPDLQDIFADYARVVFESFGDRVKLWLTFNEPIQICEMGYSLGYLAPAYHSAGIACYMCSRTILLSHAEVWRMYDEEFRPAQKGRISITIDSNWNEADTEDDKDAVERVLQMDFGWWANPIFSKDGDYPAIMKDRVDARSTEEGFSKSRLIAFTSEEVQFIRGTFDFFGLNHYTSRVIKEGAPTRAPTPSHERDMDTDWYLPEDWISTANRYMKVYPEGIRRLLNWIKNTYDNPEVIITENGYPGSNLEGLDDCGRVYYYNKYIEQVSLAIEEDGVNVTAYTAWSLLDNFEWFNGYDLRFGLYHVDFNDPNRTRYAKQSVYVYAKIATTKSIDFDYTPDGFEQCENK